MVRPLRATPLTVLALCLGLGSLLGAGAHFAAQISGSPTVIENTDPRFSVSNTWTEIRPQTAPNNEQVFAYWAAQAGVPVKATWRVPVTPGSAHAFYLTFTPFSADKMDKAATIRVLDGTTVLLTKQVNQNTPPADKQLLGRGWIVLGTATPTSGEVTIESVPSVQTIAAGTVFYHVADAVATEKGGTTAVTPPPGNTSCPKIFCATPPAGCSYDGTKAAKDANGCVIDCGSLVCPNSGPTGTGPDVAISVKDDRSSGRAFVFTISNVGTAAAGNVSVQIKFPSNVTITMPQSSDSTMTCATAGIQTVNCQKASMAAGQTVTVRVSYAPTSYCSYDMISAGVYVLSGTDTNSQNNAASLASNLCVCGNGTCEPTESEANCAVDCKKQAAPTPPPTPVPTGTPLCNISSIPWTVIIPGTRPAYQTLQLGAGGGWLNIYDEMKKGTPLGVCGSGQFTDPGTGATQTRSYIDTPFQFGTSPATIRTYCPYGTDCVTGFCRKYSDATMAQCGSTRSWNSACTDDQGIGFMYAPSTLTKGPDKSQNKCDINGSLISYFCNNKITDNMHGSEPSVGVYVSGGCPYQNGSWLTCVSDAAGTGYCGKGGTTAPVPPTSPAQPTTPACAYTPSCPAPPQGCSYDATKVSKNASGCPLDCGPLVCAPKCGNGQCESGETSATCPTDCKPAVTPPTLPTSPTTVPTAAEYCGDGKVQNPPEQCDDGNFKNGDGCTSRCMKETTNGAVTTIVPTTTGTFNVPAQPILTPTTPTVSGMQDLAVKATLPQSTPQGPFVLSVELSNMGTKTATDAKVIVSTGGLQETMTANTGNCTQAGIQISCGPFVLDPGKTNSFTVTLKPAAGTACGMTVQESAAVTTSVPEVNTTNNYSAAYTEYLCPGTTQSGTHICGDGKVETNYGESCDDGNTANGDGCDSSCQYETSVPKCGDLACSPELGETPTTCPSDCRSAVTQTVQPTPLTTAGAVADLTIQLGSMPGSFIQGSSFYSMIYIQNPGAQRVTDVMVTTQMPTGFTLAAGAEPTCKQSGTSVTCGPLTVEKNAIKTISLPVDAKSNLTCWTQNVQTYTLTSASDTNAANNSVKSSITVQCNDTSPQAAYVNPTQVPPYPVGAQCEWNHPQMQDFSADGSTMVFSAQSDGNVAGDTEQGEQIYVYKTATKQTKKYTDETGALGIPLTGENPKISGNGQVVIFNGKPKQVNAAGARMIQLNLGANSYKEISNAAGKPVGVSADGRYSAFYNYGFCLYVYDNVTDTTTIVSRRNSEQTSTVCSPSARNATNAEVLVTGQNQGEAHMLPDGTLYFTMLTGTNPLVYSTGNLYAYNSATKQVKTVGPFEGHSLLFSTDGKNMLFTGQTDNIGRRTFFRQPTDLSTPKQAVDTNGAGGANDGGFYLLSATGDLRFASFKGGNPQTLKIFDGSASAATDLGAMEMSTLWTAFSANGTYFTFTHKGEGTYTYRGSPLDKNALFVRAMNGGQTVAVPKPGSTCPAI